MAKAFAFGGLIVIGLMVADIWTHPQGTQAASQGFQGIETPVIHGLLGSTS